MSSKPLASAAVGAGRGGSFYRRRGKRLFDVAAAIVGLVVLGPLLVAISLVIKVSEPRLPVIYSSLRGGRHGTPFAIYKFRTMRAGASDAGPITLAADDRVTPLGKVLRRFKADELPQLINVLKGDMSLVGPRPLEIAELKTFRRDPVIESVRPGITDRGSLRFLRQHESMRGDDPLRVYGGIREAKDHLAVESIAASSFREDLRVILATIWQTFR